MMIVIVNMEDTGIDINGSGLSINNSYIVKPV